MKKVMLLTKSFVVLSLLFCSIGVFADIPKTINVQGKVTNDSGGPITGTTAEVHLYISENGGRYIPFDPVGGNPVKLDSEGLYNVDINLKDMNFYADKEYKFKVEVTADRTTIRSDEKLFASNPFAFYASSSTYALVLDPINGKPLENENFYPITDHTYKIKVGEADYAVSASSITTKGNQGQVWAMKTDSTQNWMDVGDLAIPLATTDKIGGIKLATSGTGLVIDKSGDLKDVLRINPNNDAALRINSSNKLTLDYGDGLKVTAAGNIKKLVLDYGEITADNETKAVTGKAINAALSEKQAKLTSSNVTTSGEGNVVDSVTASDGAITITKNTTLGSGVLTIQKNGTNVDTFSANATGDKTINITVPTNNNQLDNGAGYITGITSTDVTTALGFTPYNATNPNGYISGITSTDVTTALGFTPYNSTNPNGYISGITSTDVTTALGFTPYNSTNPNGYISGITSTDVTTALGFTPYNSTNPDGYISGITSTDVTTALGFTPYNSTNPDGYISGITSGDVTTALGFTPYNSTNPDGYITKSVADLENYTLSDDLAAVATTGKYSDLTEKLSAGSNITIQGSTISATNTTYTGSDGIAIDADNNITIKTDNKGVTIDTNGNLMANIDDSTIKMESDGKLKVKELPSFNGQGSPKNRVWGYANDSLTSQDWLSIAAMGDMSIQEGLSLDNDNALRVSTATGTGLVFEGTGTNAVLKISTGTGLAIDSVTNTINVTAATADNIGGFKLASNDNKDSGLKMESDILKVNVGTGLTIDTGDNTVKLTSATTNGLGGFKLTNASDSGLGMGNDGVLKVNVGTGKGLEIDSSNEVKVTSIGVSTTTAEKPFQRKTNGQDRHSGDYYVWAYDYDAGTQKWIKMRYSEEYTWDAFRAGADLAEIYQSTEKLVPGDIVSIDPAKDNAIVKTKVAEDTMVAGVISTEPGVLMNQDEKGYKLALVGKVPTKVCNEGGAIKRGDLLVSASIPGYAKKAGDNPKVGTVIGKALENSDSQKGTILVLVNLQ